MTRLVLTDDEVHGTRGIEFDREAYRSRNIIGAMLTLALIRRYRKIMC